MSDLGAVREQATLFGWVASDSTAFRTIQIASTPGMLDGLRAAHATARERFWELHGAPGRLTIDVDATLITSHSEKENAAGTTSTDTGLTRSAPMPIRRGRRWRSCCARGNAGSNTAADHVTVIDRSLAQIPDEHIEAIEISSEPIRPAPRTRPPITASALSCGSPSATS